MLFSLGFRIQLKVDRHEHFDIRSIDSIIFTKARAGYISHAVEISDEHDGIESICSCTINMGYVNDQTDNSDKVSHQMGYDYQENLQRRNKASIPSMMIHGETR